MQELKFNFIFLLYVSRSGSTFLAKQLADTCEDLLVIPESQYVRTILAYHRFNKEANPGKLAKLILEDPRFVGFGISKKVVENTLQEFQGPKEAIVAITQKIIDKLGNNGALNVLIKDGGLVDYIAEAKLLFPNLKVLHIQRDPRACISSLLNTPKAFIQGNSSMGWNDIEMCTKQYKTYLQKIESIVNSDTRIENVKYEKLIDDTENILAKTIKNLGLTGVVSKENVQWDHLRKQENVIHKNIYKPAQKERLDAWTYELSNWEKIYLEAHLKEYIDHQTVSFSKKELFLSKVKAKRNHLMAVSKLNKHRFKRYIIAGSWDLLILKLKSRFSK